MREQGIEGMAPVGDDLSVCALPTAGERYGPAYQVVVVLPRRKYPAWNAIS
jgi:hypothetical protein